MSAVTLCHGDQPGDYGGQVWSFDPTFNASSISLNSGTARYTKIYSQGTINVSAVEFIALKGSSNLTVGVSIYQAGKLLVSSASAGVAKGVNTITIPGKVFSGYANVYLSISGTDTNLALSGMTVNPTPLLINDTATNNWKSGLGSSAGVTNATEPAMNYSTDVLWLMLK